MSGTQTCPQCGAALPSDALEGLCQDCLGKLALESEGQRPEVRGQRSDGSNAANEVGRDVPIAPRGEASTQTRRAGDSSPYQAFGDYELLSEIAQGGMGVVFKARQVSLNRTVAVKMIRAGPFASKEFVHRFRVEASAAAVLQHPNIVAVHEVGVHEGQHFFSMDYVAGKNLAQIVRDGPLPPQRAARYVQKIAEAIHYAHQSGILHRDLKPSNVLIDQSDQPRITDFGLAKQLNVESSATLTGEVMGTPGYMPPEQASGNRGAVKAWSDVYSLGAILYHLLTGRAPFAAGSLEETLNQVLHQDPASLRLLNPAVPRDLDTICLKSLEKEPAKRYLSAQQLADELTRFLNHEPIQARPISAVGKAARWCRRKPALATALGLLVLVAVGSPIAALRINRARQLAEEHRELAESRLYGADMNLAAQALRDGSLGAAKAILERHRKETNLTGFEWRYLWQRCRGDYEFSLAGHQSYLCKVAFSPDGRLLASRDYEHVLKVWDLATRVERLSLTNIMGLAGFTPDGSGLILGTRGYAIVLCDVATGRFTRRYENLGEPLGLLADGRTLATTRTNFLVQYFDLPSGQETARLPGAGGIWWALGRESCFVSLSGDGRYLVNCEDIWAITNKVRFTVWDVSSQTRLATHEEQFTNRASMLTHDRIQLLQMLPDSLSVTWAAPDRFVRFWQWTNGAAGLTVVPNRQAGVYALAASADGQWLATGSSDETIKLWDRTSLREMALLQGHEDRVTTLSFSPDDRWLASGSRDRRVKLWNVARQRAPDLLSGVSGNIGLNQIAFTPDRTLAAIVMDNSTVALVNAGTLQHVLTLTNSVTHVGFIKGGTNLVTLASENPPKLEIWNVAVGTVVHTVPLAGLTKLSDMGRFEPSPDGTRLAISMADRAVHLIDVDSGRELACLPGAGDAVRALGFSLDGELLMGSDEAGRVLFWDLKQSKLIRNIPGHSSVSFTLAISPAGKVLATASRGQIRLWDIATGEPQGDFPAHRQTIFGLAFSPDGKTLASASTDGTLKLWRLPALQEVCTIPFSERPGSDDDHRFARVAFAPDGNSLWASTRAGDLKVWRATPWAAIAQEESRPQTAQAK